MELVDNSLSIANNLLDLEDNVGCWCWNYVLNLKCWNHFTTEGRSRKKQRNKLITTIEHNLSLLEITSIKLLRLKSQLANSTYKYGEFFCSRLTQDIESVCRDILIIVSYKFLNLSDKELKVFNSIIKRLTNTELVKIVKDYKLSECHNALDKCNSLYNKKEYSSSVHKQYNIFRQLMNQPDSYSCKILLKNRIESLCQFKAYDILPSVPREEREKFLLKISNTVIDYESIYNLFKKYPSMVDYLLLIDPTEPFNQETNPYIIELDVLSNKLHKDILP